MRCCQAGGAAVEPRGAGELIGRRGELEQLATWLRAGERLVTISGLPGCGKSALARAATTMHAGAVRTIACELAGAADVPAALAQIAARLGVALRGGDDLLPRVVAALADRVRVLLLDDADHLLPSLLAVVEALRAGAPALQLIVTSTERLRLGGEALLELAPLPEAELLLRACAARLAVDLSRSRRAQAIIAELVDELDRVPLAIELAAEGLRVMSLEELRDFVIDEQGTLTTTRRDRDVRHCSWPGALGRSFDRLFACEQRVLARCSRLPDGFTRARAESALSPGGPRGAALLAVLQSLRDQSLVRVTPVAPAALNAPLRFMLPRAVRRIARERVRVGDVAAATAPDRALVALGPDAAWVRLAGGQRIDLGRRKVLRNVVRELAELHARQPGSAMSSLDLVAAAWPGEKMSAPSGLNRLYVALATLRSLGLRDAIERVEDGYRLRPSLSIAPEAAPAACDLDPPRVAARPPVLTLVAGRRQIGERS